MNIYIYIICKFNAFLLLKFQIIISNYNFKWVKLFVLFSSTNSSFFVLAIIRNLSVIGNWVIFPHFQKTNRDYMVYISKKYQFANRNRYIGFRRHFTELKSSGDLNRPSPNSRLLEEYKLQPKIESLQGI